MLGGQWGESVALPQKPGDELLFRPRPVETGFVAVPLLVAALIALGEADIVVLPVPRRLVAVGIWAWRWYCS